MPTKTRSASRMPRDVHARQRLREAQQAEARALAGVYAARGEVDRVAAKLADAEEHLRTATAELVEISGLDRTAALIGATRSSLRRMLAPTPQREETQT